MERPLQVEELLELRDLGPERRELAGLVLRGDETLEQMAAATGGRAFFPYKQKDITHSFVSIEDELRSQYVVSYHPADFDADGRYRSIEITALKKDLQVRARKGYYAPRQ